jgi:hypothetical protein
VAEDDPVSEGVADGLAERDVEVDGLAEPDGVTDGLAEPDGDGLVEADSATDGDGLAEPPLITTSRAFSLVTVTVTVSFESL